MGNMLVVAQAIRLCEENKPLICKSNEHFVGSHGSAFFNKTTFDELPEPH